MSKIPFDEKELKVVGEAKSMFGSAPLYDTPVSLAEGAVRAFRDHDPVWLPTGVETQTFCPSVISDNIARAFVFEGQPWPQDKVGGKDIFGVEWVYVPQVGGSMVKPGAPTLEDANDWKSVIKIPDVDSWDWEGSGKLNAEYLNTGKANVLMLLNGCWFERLISFMDFEGAAMALIDDDQIDAVKEMTHEMTTMYLKIIDRAVEVYNLHGVCIHDDWGSQAAPFFSESVAREVYLPEMKRFTEHVHSKGLFCELHSCGHVESRVEIFIEAGFDAWAPMNMNNTIELYENYGDKIAIGVVSDFMPDFENSTEEEQREAARAFAKRFAKPGTTCTFSFYNGILSDAYREELYKASRIEYSK